MKLMFVDVKKSHVNAKCEEGETVASMQSAKREKWVELPGEFAQFGRYAKLQRFMNSMMKAALAVPNHGTAPLCAWLRAHGRAPRHCV